MAPAAADGAAAGPPPCSVAAPTAPWPAAPIELASVIEEVFGEAPAADNALCEGSQLIPLIAPMLLPQCSSCPCVPKRHGSQQRRTNSGNEIECAPPRSERQEAISFRTAIYGRQVVRIRVHDRSRAGARVKRQMRHHVQRTSADRRATTEMGTDAVRLRVPRLITSRQAARTAPALRVHLSSPP